MLSFEMFAVVCLIILAFGDLIVGVVNDAVNFLNSAIGAKVASRNVIMGVAGVGIILGSTFSDGIIEVARKGIFHPEFFSLQEAIIIFTAVALTDIILLDLYSTFGLPTSTTVSIVFELLGAALVLAVWKMGSFEEALMAINSTSAIKIILGILLSVVVAFSMGALVQLITRMMFTFDYKPRLKKWGFLWCGVALTSLEFFILLKGSKHASFMTTEIKSMISENTFLILGISFILLSFISYILIKKEIKILKLIILIGTGALAMAFAGNDLANFIAVSIAGVHAFLGNDLAAELPTPTWVLLLAGGTMFVAIFTSKKAQTVVNTSLNLASHKKGGTKRWKGVCIADKLAKRCSLIFGKVVRIFPEKLVNKVKSRWDRTNIEDKQNLDFDKMRAAVNLMVAGALISLATSFKLPLSTTYVTFMVVMGSSLADGVWDKETAGSRLAGMFMVVGGWFMTAIIALIATGFTVSILYLLKGYGLILMVLVVMVVIWKLWKVHKKREMC